MKKLVSRKLFLFGRYSLALLPPKKWLTKLGVKEGDTVEMKLETSKKRLVVYFDNDAKTTKKNSDKEDNNTDKPDNGWEPIPRI